MSAIVEFVDMRKSFGSVEILKGVSFSADRGEVVAIIGQSGSGKSTALRCIDGLETIEGGELWVCGHALHRQKVDLKALRRDVGIVFQSYNLFPHLTAEQNVALAPHLVAGKSRKEALDIAEEVLGKVGLAEKRASYPEQLSGGSSSAWPSLAAWPCSPS